MKNQAMAMMNCQVSDNFSISEHNISAMTVGTVGIYPKPLSCWDFWQDYYYPQVIYSSYPVYIQERAKDKAKQAYEIIKILKDKKLANIEKVSDFIDLMDELIKIL